MTLSNTPDLKYSGHSLLSASYKSPEIFADVFKNLPEEIDILERKKLRDELVNIRIREQKRINIAIISALEEERNRLSEELHDNVNQLLTSAKLHISVAKNSETNRNELLDKASDYIMTAVAEIRKLSKSLNSKIISNIGLQKSLYDIISNFKSLMSIEIDTDINLKVLEKLNKEQQLMIFRVVQEQSNNIIKYSQATKVRVIISEDNIHNCKLLIEDNGIGFDAEQLRNKRSQGIGFTNIHSRVDVCNGKLKIISSPGNGCVLEIIFPI